MEPFILIQQSKQKLKIKQEKTPQPQKLITLIGKIQSLVNSHTKYITMSAKVPTTVLSRQIYWVDGFSIDCSQLRLDVVLTKQTQGRFS